MTRGIRNNNPLNIRISNNDWQGKTPPDPLCKGEGETEFEQFESMYYGFRAAIKTIETYIIEHECNTINSIIRRWAPPRVRKPAAKADTAPLNQQAAGTSALPNTTSCAGDPIWVEENDTEHYISQVCRLTGIGGNEVLSNYDKRIKRLVAAMARVESGENIVDYYKALDKAFDDFVPRVPAEKAPRKFYR